MGALPGKCKHPRKGNPYYGNDETKVCGRNPELKKDAMTSGKRRIEPLPWDTRKIPKGTYHVMDTGKRHPEGIRQNTVKRAMTRTKRQAGAHPRT